MGLYPRWLERTPDKNKGIDFVVLNFVPKILIYLYRQGFYMVYFPRDISV